VCVDPLGARVLSCAGVPAPSRHGAGVLTLALAALALLPACGDGSGDAAPRPSRVPVEVAGRPQRGPADAWVTVVEFADFECPFCQAVEPTLAALSAEYGDDLRLVFRHLPLVQHPHAEHAAIATECAFAQGEALFWALHDRLLAGGALDDASLAAQAADAGVDAPAWGACFTGPAPSASAALDADVAAALAAGVAGTPTFFVNGLALVGNQPIDRFRSAIDRARSEARASGLPRAEYYDRAVLGR
jgi:protein-disulfide isomerase